MTPDERYDELDQEDAAHADVLADLGVAIREFAAARKVYEQAIAAAGAAGARMKAAALAEERALEAVRIAHGAPIVTAEILDADERPEPLWCFECETLGRNCIAHRRPEEASDACAPVVEELAGGKWAWHCFACRVGNYGCANEAAARRAAASHAVGSL